MLTASFVFVCTHARGQMEYRSITVFRLNWFFNRVMSWILHTGFREIYSKGITLHFLLLALCARVWWLCGKSVSPTYRHRVVYVLLRLGYEEKLSQLSVCLSVNTYKDDRAKGRNRIFLSWLKKNVCFCFIFLKSYIYHTIHAWIMTFQAQLLVLFRTRRIFQSCLRTSPLLSGSYDVYEKRIVPRLTT